MTDATGILVVDKKKDSIPDVKIISFSEKKLFKILFIPPKKLTFMLYLLGS